jgi:hypothetical protein
MVVHELKFQEKIVSEDKIFEAEEKVREIERKYKEKKSQFILDIEQRKVNEELSKRLVVKPITEAEKQEIYSVIRWNLMSHEQLVDCSMDRELESARPQILSGLSLRLVNHEKSNLINETFINKPRISYDGLPMDQLRSYTPSQLANYRRNVVIDGTGLGGMTGVQGAGLAGLTKNTNLNKLATMRPPSPTRGIMKDDYRRTGTYH